MPPWNGSGTFDRDDGTRSGTKVWQDARDAGVNIRADDHDTHDQDIADGLENTVTLDGQNTTTTDNAILRFDSGNTQFEGVSISASQLVGRSATGDTRGMSAATARQTIGLGSAVPTNQQALFFSSANSQYEQKSAATARAFLGLGTTAPTNGVFLQYASASSQFVERSATGSDTSVVTGTKGSASALAQWNSDGDLIGGPSVLDEDDMSSDSASDVPTQQSTKAYVDGFNGAGLVPLNQHNVTTATSNITDTTSIDGTYEGYIIQIERMRPATDSTALHMQIGDTDGINTGSSSYQTAGQEITSGDASNTNTSSGSDKIILTRSNVGNATDEGVYGHLMFIPTTSSSLTPMVKALLAYINTSGNFSEYTGGGFIDSSILSNRVDRFRLQFSSGNISRAKVRVYGVVNS